ncbi:MAG: HAD-IC family P-type ATPase, partial [Planctomycetes bacterium]|nr:HAD-IC family P-type ATPase [Planctomycetota bacterium]
VLAAAGCAVGVLIWGAATGRFEAGLTRALALLVVACPCSIGIAAPLTLTRALAAAARHGAVVQSLEGFERLGRIAAVASDKTGTLTEGDAPTLRLCDPAGNALIAEEFARHAPLLAALAHASQHPIARALRDRLAGIEPAALAEVVEIPGRGVLARTLAGTAVTLERAPQPAGDRAPGELRSTLRLAGTPVLEVALREQLRPGVATLGSELRRRGIDLLIFSGDDSRRVEPIACALGGEGFGELLPEQKATLLAARRDRDRGIAWLGDGANDAIALAGADVSLVVDRRLEWLADAADLVLLGDRVGALPQLIDVARRARARIVTALAWAAIYHAATLTLGVLGLLTPALAALAMALGSIAVVRLALRPLDAAVDVSVALSVAASTKAPRPGPAPARRSPVPSVAAGATSS